jgi:hypothetical protein
VKTNTQSYKEEATSQLCLLSANSTASPGPCPLDKATEPPDFWQHFNSSSSPLHTFPLSKRTAFKMMFFAFGNLIYSALSFSLPSPLPRFLSSLTLLAPRELKQRQTVGQMED